jgi:hypothetical protein
MSEKPDPEAMMGLNAGVVDEFRTNGGKVGGQFVLATSPIGHRVWFACPGGEVTPRRTGS